MSAAPLLEEVLSNFYDGNLALAESQLRSLWHFRPGASEVAALMGQVQRALRRWPEAISWFERAQLGDPTDPRPLIAIGQIRRLQGDCEAARACFEQVIWQVSLQLAHAPANAQLLADLALAYAELEAHGDAIESLRSALSLDPSFTEAQRRLAQLLSQIGRVSEADIELAALQRHDPTDLKAQLDRAMGQQAMGDSASCLTQLEQLLDSSVVHVNAIRAFLFVASTQGAAQVSRMCVVARAYWQQEQVRHAQDTLVIPPPSHSFQTVMAADRPVRVGILTAELGNHPVSHFLDPFLRHHDRQRLQVELIETQARWDDRTFELRSLASNSLLLPEASMAERRQLIRERGYQVIVDTSGFTTASGLDLLAERLAPVQCHYVGFHASTYLETIDWFLADGVLIPPELEGQFSERIWRLPRPWAAYTPAQDVPAAKSAADSEDPLFGSFNQIAKIGPESLAWWVQALRAVPKARLLIKDRRAIDPAVRVRITNTMAAEGIDPARLRFEGWARDWADHMRTYNQVDVALDATPWSSATTAFEALAMGVPLVAIHGATMAGRMSSAALAGVGELGWIADSPEAFAGIARELSADLSGLRAARTERQRRALAGPLFDAPDLAHHLGEALLAIAAGAAKPMA